MSVFQTSDYLADAIMITIGRLHPCLQVDNNSAPYSPEAVVASSLALAHCLGGMLALMKISSADEADYNAVHDFLFKQIDAAIEDFIKRKTN